MTKSGKAPVASEAQRWAMRLDMELAYKEFIPLAECHLAVVVMKLRTAYRAAWRDNCVREFFYIQENRKRAG